MSLVTPSGLVPTKPMTLTVAYDPALVPAGVPESQLRLFWFDPAAGKR